MPPQCTNAPIVGRGVPGLDAPSPGHCQPTLQQREIIYETHNNEVSTQRLALLRPCFLAHTWRMSLARYRLSFSLSLSPTPSYTTAYIFHQTPHPPNREKIQQRLGSRWQEEWDPNTRQKFYHNKETMESVWIPPKCVDLPRVILGRPCQLLQLLAIFEQFPESEDSVRLCVCRVSVYAHTGDTSPG